MPRADRTKNRHNGRQGETGTEVAEEKPAFREMTSKKNQEEKTLSHRQFLTTFRSPMTLRAVFGKLCFGGVRDGRAPAAVEQGEQRRWTDPPDFLGAISHGDSTSV
jgi:hypothetical protein